MDRPTDTEARSVWRPGADVPTHQPRMSAAERAARARQAGMSISAPSDEAPKTDTPPENAYTNLARLVAQLRDERDALASEVADLRARFRVMAREMHLLGAQWDKRSPTKEV